MQPTGTIFLGATATFDETLFPCSKNSKPNGTGFGDLPPPDDQRDHNTPGTSDEEDNDENDQDDTDDNSDPSPSKTHPLHRHDKPDESRKPELHKNADNNKTPPASPPSHSRDVSFEDFQPRHDDQEE